MLTGVSVHLKGDDLAPDVITLVLGVTPSKFHKKGEKKIVSGKRYGEYKTGFWSLAVESESKSVSVCLAELLRIMGAYGEPLTSLPGVEDAYIDLFIAQTVATVENLSNSVEFSMDVESIKGMSKLGLRIELSVCNVVD